MTLQRELDELERLLLPWFLVLLGNSTSVLAVQYFVKLFKGPEAHSNNQAMVCFFLAWLAHRVPARLKLKSVLQQREPPHRKNVNAPPYAHPWMHWILGVILKVTAFVMGVALQLRPGQPLATLAVLSVFAVLVHGHQTLQWWWSSACQRFWDVAARLWVTTLTFFTACTLYQWSVQSDSASRMILLGGVWPVLRHVIRWLLFRLLLDPHGRRGTVRVYTSLSLDLPLLICIYSRSSLPEVWSLLVCLSFVDAVCLSWLRLVGLDSMFSLSNLLWVHFIAVNFLGTLQPHRLHSSDITQRVWYSVISLTGVAVVSQLLTTWRCLSLVIPVTRRRRKGKPKPRTGCCPYVFHAQREDVSLDQDTDFSDRSIPTSRHVPELIYVISQSDAMCCAIWGVSKLV